MSALQSLLSQPAPSASPAAPPKAEKAPTPVRMPSAPNMDLMPSIKVGALAGATEPPPKSNAFANFILLAAVGVGAYMFGKSRSEKPREESRDDLIPGTSITVGGENVSVTLKSPPPSMRPSAKVGAKTSLKSKAKETSIKVAAPPATLKSGMVPSLDYEFDDFDVDYGASTRRF